MMRKFLFAIIISCFGFALVTAQSNTVEKVATTTSEAVGKNLEEANVDGPLMTFEDKVINYGEIEQNADPYRYFRFTNTGNAPLLITSAKGSCGCTVPTYPEEAIEPGQSGEIKVRYATNRIGAFRKTVTLTTNMPESETVVLTIEGKVNKKEEAPSGVPGGEKNMFRNNGNNSKKN